MGPLQGCPREKGKQGWFFGRSLAEAEEAPGPPLGGRPDSGGPRVAEWV